MATTSVMRIPRLPEGQKDLRTFTENDHLRMYAQVGKISSDLKAVFLQLRKELYGRFSEEHPQWYFGTVDFFGGRHGALDYPSIGDIGFHGPAWLGNVLTPPHLEISFWKNGPWSGNRDGKSLVSTDHDEIRLFMRGFGANPLLDYRQIKFKTWAATFKIFGWR